MHISFIWSNGYIHNYSNTTSKQNFENVVSPKVFACPEAGSNQSMNPAMSPQLSNQVSSKNLNSHVLRDEKLKKAGFYFVIMFSQAQYETECVWV